MAKKNQRSRSRGKGSRYKKREQRQQRMIIGAVAVIALIIVGAIAFNLLTAPPSVSQERLEQEARLGTGGTVQIVQYSSYGCPGCRSIHQSGVVDRLVQRYGSQIQYVFRNFPNFRNNDPLAAEVAQCALDQGDAVFWDVHDAIYGLTEQEFEAYEEGNFVALTGGAGADEDAIQTCLDERTHERTVDYWERESRRVTETAPTIFVNGERLANTSALESVVANELGQ